MIRKAIVDDLDQIVDVHLASFPGFFLSSLGRGFLKAFYKEFIIDRKGCCFVSIEENKAVGFVVGIVNPSDFYKRTLKKRYLQFALALLRTVIRNPSVIGKLLRRAAAYTSKSPEGDNVALLSSIAVLPMYHKKKIGEELVKAFLKDIESRGVEEVTLTTDGLNNDKVIRFYHKLGFRIKNSFTTSEGREMHEFTIRLNNHYHDQPLEEKFYVS